MKVIDMTCPHCGARLKMDPDSKQAVCEFCGTALLIDDEVQHIRCDNSEDAGYQFEKGRQRAQAEAFAARAEANAAPPQPKSRRKTWLWVLGWIFIFPVPLTILVVRSPKLSKGLKLVILLAAWAVYLLLYMRSVYSQKQGAAQVSRLSPSFVSAASCDRDEVPSSFRSF